MILTRYNFVIRVVSENIHNTFKVTVPSRWFSKTVKLCENSSSSSECLQNTRLCAQYTQPHIVKYNDKSNEKLSSKDANKEESTFSVTENNMCVPEVQQNYDDLGIPAVTKDELPDPLDPCEEDLSHITPYALPTFNFAAYADKSETIKHLVDMGVNLFLVEKKKGALDLLLPLDFDRDVKPYIQFLHDNGVPSNYLGEFFTCNPYIFKEDLDHLNTRIRYLKVHKFTNAMIKNIIVRAPYWLNFTTQKIDKRLGYFQNTFKLNGEGIRRVATTSPKLILTDMDVIRNNTFAVKEEMGFDVKQTRAILLKKPLIFRKSRHRIVTAFDYLHNEMKISHEQIVKEPLVLLCRPRRLEQRYKFLQLLKRAQFDPKQPMYVSLRALVSGTDVEFCRDVAKVTVATYNEFLKTF